MNRAARTFFAIAMLSLAGQLHAEAPTKPDLSKYDGQFERWEPAIERFEKLDSQTPDPEGAVLLIGSSSIRLWETAAEDLAPYPVIRRGYGGARFSDLANFADRLITPHKFRAVVVFVGNDVTGGSGDIPPAETGKLFGYVADLITHHQPEAQIVCCDVRPCPSRFHVWDKIQGSNAALRAECEKRPNAHYLDTLDTFLTDGGTAPRPELHRGDRLHLNAEGYEVWSALIKDELDQVLGE